jgi:hypothetical protein
MVIMHEHNHGSSRELREKHSVAQFQKVVMFHVTQLGSPVYAVFSAYLYETLCRVTQDALHVLEYIGDIPAEKSSITIHNEYKECYAC